MGEKSARGTGTALIKIAPIELDLTCSCSQELAGDIVLVYNILLLSVYLFGLGPSTSWLKTPVFLIERAQAGI